MLANTLLGIVPPIHLDDRNMQLHPRAFITPVKSIHIIANSNNTAIYSFTRR